MRPLGALYAPNSIVTLFHVAKKANDGTIVGFFQLKLHFERLCRYFEGSHRFKKTLITP